MAVKFHFYTVNTFCENDTRFMYIRFYVSLTWNIINLHWHLLVWTAYAVDVYPWFWRFYLFIYLFIYILSTLSLSQAVQHGVIGRQWIRNWKSSRRKRPLNKLIYSPGNFPVVLTKSITTKKLSRVGVPADIRTSHLPNTIRKHYLFSQLSR